MSNPAKINPTMRYKVTKCNGEEGGGGGVGGGGGGGGASLDQSHRNYAFPDCAEHLLTTFLSSEHYFSF